MRVFRETLHRVRVVVEVQHARRRRYPRQELRLLVEDFGMVLQIARRLVRELAGRLRPGPTVELDGALQRPPVPRRAPADRHLALRNRRRVVPREIAVVIDVDGALERPLDRELAFALVGPVARVLILEPEPHEPPPALRPEQRRLRLLEMVEERVPAVTPFENLIEKLLL